jgi:NAD(P)H-dependent FMN reductase
MKLAVVLGTVREGRLSERLAQWVVNEAAAREGTEVELIDLKDYPMPFFDEPISPRYNPERKVTGNVEKWLAKLQAADAYIYVTPEYNHSIPGVLKNAQDYVTWEMVKKPAAVVSHGTVGGVRAAMHLKEVLSESRACIIPAHVAIHGRVGELLDEQGNMTEEAKAQPYGPQTALNNLLDELRWYSDALAGVRGEK